MQELDLKKVERQKNWCFLTVVLEDSWELLGVQKDQTSSKNPKGNQPWRFIRRTDAEAPILWLPDRKSQLISKDPDDGKDWRQKKEGEAEDEMAACGI